MPDSPDTPIVEASGWGPVAGDGTGLTQRLAQLIGDGYRVEAQFKLEDNPFRSNPKPRVVTTDDYFSKRKDH